MLTTRCGFVALVGRPNVGKSTLLNRILGQRLSITSRKPQTTRHRILGVRNGDGWQALYVDTPGMHGGGPSRMNRIMNRAVLSTMADVDVVLWVLDGVRHTQEDQQVLDQLQKLDCPRIAVLNKVDALEDRARLLPRIAQLDAQGCFSAIVPLSALDGHNVEALEAEVSRLLPEGPALYPDDMLTDRSERFLASEMIREQIVRGYGDELPYQTAVCIDRFELKDEILHIDATIYVERESQKKILLGSRGLRMRDISTSARETLQRFFGHQVMLRNWVRVSRSWSDNERMLRQLGVDEQ